MKIERCKLYAQTQFDTAALPSNFYFYRFMAEEVADGEDAPTARSFISMKKMVLIR